MDCVFCAIAERRLPAHCLYEDEDFIVLLDIFPLRPAHLLIVAKGHAPLLAELPPVAAAVVLDGPIRIADFVGVDQAVCGAPVIATMMGGTPAEQPTRYAMLDPLANKPLVKRLLVVDGALPDPDPAMIAGLRAQGIAVEVISVTQDQHFNLLVPGTKDFAAYGRALLDIAGGR